MLHCQSLFIKAPPEGGLFFLDLYKFRVLVPVPVPKMFSQLRDRVQSSMSKKKEIVDQL